MHISEFRKHRPDIVMSNNYDLLRHFSRPCSLVRFVHFDYFIIKHILERMWRDDYLLYCDMLCIINTRIELSVIWYIGCSDWLVRKMAVKI